MGTLEYIAQKQVSLSDNKISAQKSSEDKLSFNRKNFITSEIDELLDITATEIVTHRILKQKGFITYEHWDESIFLSSRVIKVLKDYVHCECILSKESKAIEVRAFPRLLFSHISSLSDGTPIKIKISKKAGSVRTDIIDGRGLGIEKDFEIFSSWEQLKDFENKPF